MTASSSTRPPQFAVGVAYSQELLSRVLLL